MSFQKCCVNCFTDYAIKNWIQTGGLVPDISLGDDPWLRFDHPLGVSVTEINLKTSKPDDDVGES